VDHRQNDWPEWLAIAEFAVNSKVHLATKTLSFMEKHRREMYMGADIRRKGKVKKDNQVCEKNEKGIEGGRSCTKKNTRGDKEISR